MGMKRRRLLLPPEKLRWESNVLRAHRGNATFQMAGTKTNGWNFKVWHPWNAGEPPTFRYSSKVFKKLSEAKQSAQEYYEQGLRDGTIRRRR